MFVRTFFMYLITFGYIVAAAHSWFSYFKDGIHPINSADRMLFYFGLTATGLAVYFSYLTFGVGHVPPGGTAWLGWSLNIPGIVGIALIDRFVVGQKIMENLIREVGDLYRDNAAASS